MPDEKVPLYNPPASALLYGGPGSGKTFLACSSFYDYEEGKSIANGKLITFGVEDNPALDVPEEHRQIGTRGTSLRLVSPRLDSQEFLKTFQKVQIALYEENNRGNPVDVVVIDGLSELDLMFQSTTQLQGYDRWNALIDEMFSTVSLMQPLNIGCPVIITARVMEKKEARFDKDGRETAAGDPDYMNFDYYPSLRGQFRLHLPHAFSLVLYLETMQTLAKEGPYKGGYAPIHIVNMARTGGFYVKNQWEHKWMRAGLPLRLANTTWPKLWERIVSVNKPLAQIARAGEPETSDENSNEEKE